MTEALGETVNDTPIAFESEQKVIIALDFSTTYSGVAYCFPGQVDPRVEIVTSWRGMCKVLLEIYDRVIMLSKYILRSSWWGIQQ